MITFLHSKLRIAVAIAILFHIIGLVGILFFNAAFFASLTPFNLLLSASLLIWTQEEKNNSFFIFVLVCYVVGFIVEYLGVNYGVLFGSYEYGSVLGMKFKNIPLIIGVNWFIIMYCSGVSVQLVLNHIWNKVKYDDMPLRNNVGFVSVILDGALLAVFFDWVMEPVAVKLIFWKWLGDGSIPMFNYVCWFLVSCLLLLVFRLLPFKKNNHFALHLLLIQLLFFLILRTFL